MSLLLTHATIHNKQQNLLIHNGLIAYLGNQFPEASHTINLSGKHIIPGMIDPHTHIRDLRQTDKEDWTSASKAAIKGGVTTVFDMPNNRPPTVNLEYLNLKREVAKKSLVHYKFNIAATADNLDGVQEMLASNPQDVASLKLFLAGSNSNEFVNDHDVIKRIFEFSLQYDLPVMIHSEWQACVEEFSRKVSKPTVLDHHYIRNRKCAAIGTEVVLKIAQAIGNKIYIAHTSVAEELDLIRAYKDKVHVFCEITPHHLLINELILKEVGNYGKVNPPLRTPDDNQALWQAIADGTVDTIGSDHAPHRLEEKNKEYAQAPSGFPGLETSLPLLLQEVKKGNLTLERLVQLTSTHAAKIFGLEKTGKIEEGYRADLVVFDLKKSGVVCAQEFETKAKYSPFEGMEIVPIEQVFVQGKHYTLA